MKLTTAVELLRLRLKEMIAENDTTGSEIARSVGTTQAHISNFLNEQRGISFELADKLLQFAGLDAADIIGEQAVLERLPVEQTSFGNFISVPVLAARYAMVARPQRRHTQGQVLVPEALLPQTIVPNGRSTWVRLIVILHSKRECLVVDRHATHPTNGRFAIKSGDSVELGRLVTLDDRVAFCPANPDIAPTENPRIVGRIVQVQVNEAHTLLARN